MREAALFLREPHGFGNDDEPSRARSWLRAHRIPFGVAAAAAFLLAGVDAFGTAGVKPWKLYAYWFIVSAAGSLVTGRMLTVSQGRGWFRNGTVGGLAASALLTSLAMLPLVWLLAAVMVGGSWRPDKLLVLAPQVLLLAAAFAPLLWLLTRDSARTSEQVADDAPVPDAPTLLDRLPHRLCGAELYAVEAEDHYLRFHTSAGSALLLMRLGDAIDGLAQHDGAQTHRSWWAARGAVMDVKRDGGRVRLVLKNGLEVPISRTHLSPLRKQGWLRR